MGVIFDVVVWAGLRRDWWTWPVSWNCGFQKVGEWSAYIKEFLATVTRYQASVHLSRS